MGIGPPGVGVVPPLTFSSSRRLSRLAFKLVALPRFTAFFVRFMLQ